MDLYVNPRPCDAGGRGKRTGYSSVCFFIFKNFTTGSDKTTENDRSSHTLGTRGTLGSLQELRETFKRGEF